jgi:hypothetical protein
MERMTMTDAEWKIAEEDKRRQREIERTRTNALEREELERRRARSAAAEKRRAAQEAREEKHKEAVANLDLDEAKKSFAAAEAARLAALFPSMTAHEEKGWRDLPSWNLEGVSEYLQRTAVNAGDYVEDYMDTALDAAGRGVGMWKKGDEPTGAGVGAFPDDEGSDDSGGAQAKAKEGGGKRKRSRKKSRKKSRKRSYKKKKTKRRRRR